MGDQIKEEIYVARMRGLQMYAKFWTENLKGRDHSEELNVDGMILE
jgi:hypothetical protein